MSARNRDRILYNKCNIIKHLKGSDGRTYGKIYSHSCGRCVFRGIDDCAKHKVKLFGKSDFCHCYYANFIDITDGV